MEKLSLSQQELLLEVGRSASDGFVVQNNSTAAASLARKGLVTKELTTRKPEARAPLHGRQPVFNPGIVRALLKLTDVGREWLRVRAELTQRNK